VLAVSNWRRRLAPLCLAAAASLGSFVLGHSRFRWFHWFHVTSFICQAPEVAPIQPIIALLLSSRCRYFPFDFSRRFISFLRAEGGREEGRGGGGGCLLNFIQIYPANWLELHSGWFSSETGICCIFLLFLLLSLLLLLLLLLEMKIKRLKKKTKKYKKQNRTKQNKTEKQNGWKWDEKDSDTIMNAVPNWFPGVGVTITNGNNEPNSLQSSS